MTRTDKTLIGAGAGAVVGHLVNKVRDKFSKKSNFYELDSKLNKLSRPKEYQILEKLRDKLELKLDKGYISSKEEAEVQRKLREVNKKLHSIKDPVRTDLINKMNQSRKRDERRSDVKSAILAGSTLVGAGIGAFHKTKK